MALQSPSSSSFSCGFTYDVFLSFRGTDTRYGFTGHLFKALDRKGIRTFIDDRELHGGDEITPSLLKAIEESRIFIPVFSVNYASSSFCLDELVHIMECSKARGRLVVPVFYEVEPTHVRHQTGSYGKAIAKREQRFQNKYTRLINILLIILFVLTFLFLLYSHGSAITLLLLLLPLFLLRNNKENNRKNNRKNMERLQNWKKALNQAASLSGYHFKLGNEYESEFIGKIIEEVSNNINRAPLYVADHPVGLDSRLLDVKRHLNVGSNDRVCMLGIHGTGGIGKTTLARAIYNLIADRFECLCFLHNVRENSAKHGLEYLQEKLLSKTVGMKVSLGDVTEGITIIKQRLHQKKVLLILDDIDELKQLQVMAGGLDWFGLGSRVIITTRDKHLLACHGIERTYEVDELNEEEAFELLRWNAFKNNEVDSSYEDILNRVVTYASGLPLALEVVGSNLSGKKRLEDWKSLLDQYERNPNKEIQKILRVSFDGLEEEEQSVFLDIACCFKEYNLTEVEDILHAHYGDCKAYHIGVLVEKSLLKINHRVTCHDLLEDMGKEIVRQESPKEPGKRSRLWFYKDIVEVLVDNTGTRQIEIIHLNIPSSEVVEWKEDELKKMKNLKTLIIKNGSFSKGPEHLPNSLRVLEWRRYPSQNMPPDFFPKKLSIFKLQDGGLISFQLCGSLKELHKTGCIDTILEGTERIPKWFEHQSEGPSISFWFRNEIRSVALFFATESMHNKPFEGSHSIVARLIVNGREINLSGVEFLDFHLGRGFPIEPDHTYLFDLKPLHPWELEFKPGKELLRNEWIHAEVRFDSKDWRGNEVMTPYGIKSGIHIFKQKSSMEDVRFTNPSMYKKRKLNDGRESF